MFLSVHLLTGVFFLFNCHLYLLHVYVCFICVCCVILIKHDDDDRECVKNGHASTVGLRSIEYRHAVGLELI